MEVYCVKKELIMSIASYPKETQFTDIEINYKKNQVLQYLEAYLKEGKNQDNVRKEIQIQSDNNSEAKVSLFVYAPEKKLIRSEIYELRPTNKETTLIRGVISFYESKTSGHFQPLEQHISQAISEVWCAGLECFIAKEIHDTDSLAFFKEKERKLSDLAVKLIVNFTEGENILE